MPELSLIAAKLAGLEAQVAQLAPLKAKVSQLEVKLEALASMSVTHFIYCMCHLLRCDCLLEIGHA